MRLYVKPLKASVLCFFGSNRQQVLIKLQLHLLDYVFDDLDHFRTILLFTNSLYDHLKLIFKQLCTLTLKRMKTRTVDTGRHLGTS